jgi:hypothetical protein
MCSTRQGGSLNDGTLALFRTPPPDPVCSSLDFYKELIPTKKTIPPQSVWFLFMSCLNPERGLDDKSYQAAANELKVEVAAIMAVAEVETSGNAFDQEGRPRVLYERHYFHRLTNGKYSKKHPDISNSLSGGYGKFSAQYGKLERAFNLDSEAALKSASWGRFQIMGNNHQAAGYDTVESFVLAMTKSETEHLRAFITFIKNNPALLKALREKRWSDFASGYNGSSYKNNAYDTKLEAAYKRFSQPAASTGASGKTTPSAAAGGKISPATFKGRLP